MSEQWLPIPGFDGYEVSDLGRVRSYRVRGPGGYRRKEPRYLRAQKHGKGYPAVTIRYRSGKYRTRPVHALIMLAFVGPRPVGMETRHLDGNPANSVLTNLQYGTHSENCLDREQHNPRTHCKRGHPFDAENTFYAAEGYRGCRTCRRAAAARYVARKKGEAA